MRFRNVYLNDTRHRTSSVVLFRSQLAKSAYYGHYRAAAARYFVPSH